MTRPTRDGIELFVHTGQVLDIDLAAGTMTLKTRYYDEHNHVVPSYRAKNLVVPIPRDMPDWAKQKWADFKYLAPAYCKEGDFQDPGFMTGFEMIDYWWCTVDELERMIGYNGQRMTPEERAAVEARRPATYVPVPPEGCE